MQRSRLRAGARGHRGRGAIVHHRLPRGARHPGAVRARGRRLRRHQRADQPRQRRARSRPRVARDEGPPDHVPDRHRQQRRRGDRLRIRATGGALMASSDVWILGIHMTKFGKHPDQDIVDLAAEAAQAALADGGVTMKDIGVPAGGSRAADDSGRGWTPSGRYGAVAGLDGRVGTETMPGVFAQVGMEYGHRYGGVSFGLFARIAEKNHAHSTLNPLATYTRKMTLEEIMNDVMIAYPNTRSMCSANCDGAAAAVVVSDARLRTLDPDQRRRAVKVAASVLTTDPWQEACQLLPDVNTLTRNAATTAYEQAGGSPEDLDLLPLHDCVPTAELVHYDNLMLCKEGNAADFFASGATWRDGSMPVNVSGGLESKGHPIAATGIANIWEVCHHLRGEAGPRQIDGAKVGLAHVIGLGSACGLHILEKTAA